MPPKGVTKYDIAFTFFEDEKKAKCNGCGKKFSIHGRSRSGLGYHLMAKHPRLYEITMAGKEDWVPEYIRSHTDVGTIRLYEVKWEGSTETSFEPRDHLENALPVVVMYEAQLQGLAIIQY